MKMILKFNLNDHVFVQLTGHGIAQYTAFYESTGVRKEEAAELLKHAAVGDGRHRFQIHQLMNIFGAQMINGNPEQMFIKNDIEFVCSA